MNYELQHLHGIPYYTNGGTLYTFELDAGKPGEHCVPIGEYDEKSDRITYFPDWRERIQPRLDAFRAALTSQARDARNHIKPQKQRSATRAPRKSTARTKNPASVASGH